MQDSKTQTTPEQRGDMLMQQGKFREASEAYGQALKPYRSPREDARITVKQTKAMRELFKREP